ncbi:hypothetical protein Q8A73_013466 [Channa argus]|nr:hypothetical protein Q8A73_013466 [Channa argus]
MLFVRDIKPYLTLRLLPSPPPLDWQTDRRSLEHSTVFTPAIQLHDRGQGTAGVGPRRHTEPDDPELFSTPDSADRIFSTMDRSPAAPPPAGAQGSCSRPRPMEAEQLGDRVRRRRLSPYRRQSSSNTSELDFKPSNKGCFLATWFTVSHLSYLSVLTLLSDPLLATCQRHSSCLEGFSAAQGHLLCSFIDSECFHHLEVCQKLSAVSLNLNS